MKSMVTLPHHLDDYECMWNGIEDLYIQKTGETLPPNLFFVLSGFGSFCYMKTPKAELKRMVALGDGRTKQMYEFLAPLAGFKYKHYEYKTFEQALKKAKAEVDAGTPPVLGALDMYYLSYLPKLYHGEHIPFHYVLMVGYDDEDGCIYLHDCGREEIQKLPYGELQKAWDCGCPGLSKPNTVCTVRFTESRDKCAVAKEAFALRAQQFLNPPVAFVGRRGMEKLISDLPKWKTELSKPDYDAIFANLVTFLGTVPAAPNALRGSSEPDALPFYGGFDKASLVLKLLGEEYKIPAWLEAAESFSRGCAAVSELKDVIVNYLCEKDDRTDDFPRIFAQLKDIMTESFEILIRA